MRQERDINRTYETPALVHHGQKGPARRGVSGGVQATAKPARPSTRSAARSRARSTARSPLYAATEIPSPEPRYIPLQDHGDWGVGG